MPTKNPRLTITLDPPLAAQLRELSELTGNSQAALVAELLGDTREVLQRIIDTLRAARTATEAAREEMRRTIPAEIAAAEAVMEKQLGLSLERFEGVTGDLLKGVEEVKRRAAKRRAAAGEAGGGPVRRKTAAAVSTPISNRGVRSVDNPSTGKKKG
jgi:hypothetical protein